MRNKNRSNYEPTKLEDDDAPDVISADTALQPEPAAPVEECTHTHTDKQNGLCKH